MMWGFLEEAGSGRVNIMRIVAVMMRIRVDLDMVEKENSTGDFKLITVLQVMGWAMASG